MTKKAKYWFPLLSILLFVLSWGLNNYVYHSSKVKENQYSSFKSDLSERFNSLDQLLKTLSDSVNQVGLTGLFNNKVAEFAALEDEGFGLYIFDNESNLKFWSSNKFTLPESSALDGFYRKSNGWYLIKRFNHKEHTFIGQFWIKKEFGFENKYVENSFHKSLNIDPGWNLSWDQEKHSFELSLEGISKKVFATPPSQLVTKPHALTIILDVIGLVFFFLSLLLIAKELSFLQNLIFVIPVAVVVRMLLMYNNIPFSLQQVSIFDASNFYISSFIPSLGDLLLHILTLVMCVTVVVVKVPRGIKFKYGQIVVLLGVLGALYLFYGLVIAIHNISLYSEDIIDLSNIQTVGIPTVFSLLCIACLISVLSMLYWTLNSVFKQSKISFSVVLVWVLVLSVGHYILGVVFKNVLFSYSVFGGGLFFISTYACYELKQKISFPLIISVLLLFTVLVSGIIKDVNSSKKTHEKKQLLAKLGKEKDAVLEYLYGDFKERLSSDSTLIAMASNYEVSIKELLQYLRKHHIKNYWQNYDVQVHPCLPEDSLIVPASESPISCNTFFKGMKDSLGEQVSESLFYLKNNNGRISYLGQVTFDIDNYLYLEFDSKLKPDGLGFPILLLDQQAQRKALDVNYSFAHFKSGKLVKQKGTYNYSTDLSYYDIQPGNWGGFHQDGWSHFVKFNGEDVYLLSEKLKDTWDNLAEYSYLFAFYSILTFMVFLGWKLVQANYKFKLDFKTRFQLIIVFLLFFSTVFIGLGSIYYFKNQYNQKNFDAISEKIKSVQIEIQGKLKHHQNSNEFDIDQVERLLFKFSNIFFTDINLYYPNGKLIASSQNQIFEKGLVSNRIHPLALYEMLINAQTQFVQIEDIEGMQYLSAYVPFFNDQGNLLGYLNLPYFARTNDLKNEISNFIVALLNIYALLIIVALVLGLLLTNRITKPLRLIQEKMSKIQLGDANALINYKGKDEIGKLIKEYNRMVVEISESADRLAKTEREGAWREMAKQVAHEIKNPLTPMKLTIQHLKMRWMDFSEQEKNDRFDNFAQNLIQQIEALSAIASEFSSFAKLPETQFQEVDLNNVISSSVDIYNETDGVEVELIESAQAIVRGDRDQLLRVFNNLIKNAIQAIPNNIKGKVKVSISDEGKKYKVVVTDNGTGISKEVSSKIFTPNFTTKNSGMGLGLAMVQKIIENMKGDIFYETKEGEGTSFILLFPK